MRRIALIASLTLVASSLGLAAIPAQAEAPVPVTGPVLDQPVTVMLELTAAPSSQIFERARSRGRSPRSASMNQSNKVEAIAANVTRRLDVNSTVLYSTSVLYSGIAVRTTTSKLRALSNLPGVRAVHRMVAKSLTHGTSVPLTGAPVNWANPGGTGEGVTIGIIDSGIDYTHADFGGPGTPLDYQTALTAKENGVAADYPEPDKVAGGYDFAGNDYTGFNNPTPDNNPLDCGGHGSHVAGTAAGFGVVSGAAYAGPYNSSTDMSNFDISPGMAPKATLYALKVFGCEGSTLLVADALDWAADPNGDGNPADHLDIVNMSLGADFGSADDPDSVATQNAVDLGISVVVAAGNNGDMFETVGSPGTAPGAITVASSVTSESVLDGLNFVPDALPAVLAGGLQSTAYDWINDPGLIGTAKEWPGVVWGDETSAGCTTHNPADPPVFAAGEVAVLYWNDTSENYCGSRTATQNARLAGASGVIFASVQTQPVPIFGDGYAATETPPVDPIPAFLLGQAAANVFRTSLDSATAVTVDSSLSLRAAIRTTITPDPTDSLSSFSSRGTTLDGNSKPDVSAPGQAILSAWVGSGAGAVSYEGTSMASPHVAGLAALVVAKHPVWTPAMVKAAIVNNANASVSVSGPGDLNIYAPTRAGAGRINTTATLRAGSVAKSSATNGSVSVSFGVVETDSTTTVHQDVVVTNTRLTSPATYSVGYNPITDIAGATFTVSPTSIKVGPGGSATVRVTLTAVAKDLLHSPDRTLDLDPAGTGQTRDWLTIASGLLRFTPIRGTSGVSMRLPVSAAPRPVSTMKAPASVDAVQTTPGGAFLGTITMNGSGLSNVAPSPAPAYATEKSYASFFQLLGDSAAMPDCSDILQVDCIPFADGQAADLKYFGYAVDSEYAYFGIATHGPWRTASNVSSFEVNIDTTGDGVPDLFTTNSREYVDSNGTDIFIAETYALPYSDDDDPIDTQLINAVDGETDTAKIHGDVMILPIARSVLNPLVTYNSGRLLLNVGVTAESLLADVSDSIGIEESGNVNLRVGFTEPNVSVLGTSSVLGPSHAVLLDEPTSASYSVGMYADGSSTAQLLVFHHANASGNRADVISVARKFGTAATLALVPNRVTSAQRSSAQVTVTATSGTPSGRVQILEGSTIIATGTLVSGAVTIALPRLSVGRHNLVAYYAGKPTFAGTSSTSVRLTVTVR